MDKLVVSLGPAFAAGFAIQQLLEILDPLVQRLLGEKGDKKLVLGLVSFVVGLALAFGAGLRVLEPLGVPGAAAVDYVVTALIISAGTGGVNSILKFLGYSKERQKGEAAAALGRAPGPGLEAVEHT